MFRDIVIHKCSLHTPQPPRAPNSTLKIKNLTLNLYFTDRLQVLLFKDVKDSVKGAKPKHEFHVEGFYGLETGFTVDKESNVLAIVCHKQITLFAFDNREVLIQFEIRIRKSLGEGKP